MIYRIAWMLGAFGLYLPSRVARFDVVPGSTYTQLRDEFDRLGIFLGTPGPNRKFVVYAARPGKAVFVKIPLGPVSAALVAREARALEELAGDPDLAPIIPAAERIAGHLAVENVETGGVGHAALDMAEVARIHDVLERRSACGQALSELRRDWREDIPAGSIVAHDVATAGAITAARQAANSLLDGLPQDRPVPCYMAHGDFTRWNVLRAADGTARIIDWELYGLKPRWFDLVHYVVSHDLLVARAQPPEVVSHLARVATDIGLSPTDRDWWRQVGLYFAYQSLYYCAVYERQKPLHSQAIWQLEAWAGILRELPEPPRTDEAAGAERG
jgi:thiamine kinase-like enzyme